MGASQLEIFSIQCTDSLSLSLKIAYHHSLTEEEKSKEQEVSEEHPIVNLWVLKH